MSIEPFKTPQALDAKLDETTIIIKDSKQSDDAAAAPTLRTTMKEVIQFLKSSASVSISTPFQGTNLQTTGDQKRVVFSSRAEPGMARLAVVDLSSEEIIVDEGISESSIWALALSHDDQFVFAGGVDRLVKMYSLADLKRMKSFEGHSGDVNKIVISSDNRWMFTASDDGSIRLWTLNDVVPRCVVLFTSRAQFFALDLSRNDQILVAGGAEGVVYVYEVGNSFNQPGSLVKTFSHGYEIWSMKISPQNNFFAYGDDYGKLSVCLFNDWTQLKGLSAGGRFSDIDISPDEKIIIGASRDSTVRVYFKEVDKEFCFDGHSDWVKKAVFIDKGTRVVSIGDDKKLKIWKVPEPDPEKLFYQEENFNIRKMWVSRQTNQIEAICDKLNKSQCVDENICKKICDVHRETFYVTFNESGKKTILYQISSIHITFAETNKDFTEILYAHRASDSIVRQNNGESTIQNTFVCVLSQGTKTQVRSCMFPVGLSALSISKSGKLFVLGEWFKFSLVRYDSLELIQTFYAMPGEIRSLAVDNEDCLIFAATFNTVKKFTFHPDRPDNPIEELDRKAHQDYGLTEEGRTLIDFTLDCQYLICLFEVFLELVHCDTFIPIMRLERSYTGVLFNLNHTIWLYGDGFAEIYSGRSFQKMSTLCKSFLISDIILDSTSKDIYYSTQNRIFKSENPLNPSKLTLVGDSSKLQSFQSHVDKIFDKSAEEPYLQSLWLIEPVHVNLLHIYAYFNLSELLSSSIMGNEEVRVPVINSKYGFSALTVAIEKRYQDSIDAVIKPIRKLVKRDRSLLKQMLFQVIEENLIDLTKISYSTLHKLLFDIYSIDHSSYLQSYCPPGIKLPILCQSDNFFLEEKEFGFEVNENTELGSSIVFKKSLMKFYLELGSNKSLEFMQALEDCENPDIYDTPIIKQILEGKWHQVRWIMYSQALLYVLYTVLLSLFTSYESCRTSMFLVAPFIISALLYIYELIFVFLGPLTYFSDFWNVIDTLRALLMFAYCGLVWGNYFVIKFDRDEKERYMLAVLIFISWMRGITYFRINATTRYLIKLLFQVCLDIVPFMVILFYSTVAFGLIFRAFDSNVNSDFFPYLTQSYNILIGNWDNPTKPEFFSLILLLATMLNPIVSLNLLIAILSDTFETVKKDEVVADSQELAGMIVEIETLIFCNREKNLKKFIHLIEGDSADVEEDVELGVLVKNVRSKVNYLETDFKDHDFALQKFQEKVNSMTGEVRIHFSEFRNK